MISNIMVQMGNNVNEVEEGMVRHMVLNSLRNYKIKFHDEYGEMVIACDNHNYWRRKIFPYYKASRKKSMEKSELNWKAIFECLHKIRAELKETFPWRVIDVETSEADDVIATLIHKYHSTENILILSGDKDFIQLHKYDNVKQYNPVLKKYITHDNPIKYLNEHVLRGDTGDGIPNILSPDNCFVLGERQRPLTQKKIDNYLSGAPMNVDILRNFSRNKQLIDLSMIPEEVSNKILESFKAQEGKTGKDLMSYFIKHKLKNLMDSIQEFV